MHLPVPLGDNGAALKSTTVPAMLPSQSVSALEMKRF